VRAQVAPEALGVVAARLPPLVAIGDKTLKLSVAARTRLELRAAIGLDVALDGALVQPGPAGNNAFIKMPSYGTAFVVSRAPLSGPTSANLC